MEIRKIIVLANFIFIANVFGSFAEDETGTGTSQKLARFTKDQNNHKPKFSQCENYKPKVEEEKRGATVLRVKADDEDPPEAGGTVTYKIIQKEGERSLFLINNITGEITTDVAFDRDEPSRQKEVYLSVQATDNGSPPLADICTFKVTITDINDNSPSFDQAEYTIQVAIDLKENSEVMRVFAYDQDDGENAKLTYSLMNTDKEFTDYFRIDSDTGVVYLKKNLPKIHQRFRDTVKVRDNGKPPLESTSDIAILVVGSDKQPPKVYSNKNMVELPENYNYFDVDKPLAIITAESNIADKSCVFELVKGKTAQTNKDQTFVLTPRNDSTTAIITLARHLDYETVTEYSLTVRVQNKADLAASINIIVKVTDVNDEIPAFIELLKGSVVENDAAGAQAMQVRAIDKDGTAANNIVSYELLSHQNLFEIDSRTGLITSKVPFDREEESVYHVKVKAYDNSPSSLLRDGLPNSAIQTFQISIEDKNDNSPKFTKSLYEVHNISENADISKMIIEVEAVDPDDASQIRYSIMEGNINDAFEIEETTGRIKVKNKLDFEQIERYNLTVRAFDGIYQDTAQVAIFIQNENDEPPKFKPYNKDVSFEEERVIDYCILNLTAFDPDIKDEHADQKIVYKVADEHKDFLKVDRYGCVTIIKPLDRDKPNGNPQQQAYIIASDNGGDRNSLSSYAEITINLIDINDNAPFLNVTEVVWMENQDPGTVTILSADDYDSPKNGPPFTFRLANNATNEVLDKFSVEGNTLIAKVQFDREEKKYYDIPIGIKDSGTPEPLEGVSTLRVIIGDINDNPAKSGKSEIVVNKFENLEMDIKIGRVYVDDPDDWDLPDKLFQPRDYLDDNFYLSSSDNGMIVMKRDTVNGTYTLHFLVTEAHLPLIEEHTVDAEVTIIVKIIPEEAVRKSGSIRIEGSSVEQLVEKNSPEYLSKIEIFQRHVANIVNTSVENVDIVTIIDAPGHVGFVDVRFAAHGSPYYAAEKLNNKVTEHQEFEKELGVTYYMIGISECLDESACPKKTSCSNDLSIKREPAVVFTNKTSYVGVKAVVERICDCVVRKTTRECLNGGSPVEDGCSCPEGHEGPSCEILAVGFTGNDWAMYPTFDACNNTDITLSVLPHTDDGLIFYVGPLTLRHAELSKDFLSLELREGFPVLKFDFGHSGFEIISDYKKINDGALHKIQITYTSEDIQMRVDDCNSNCLRWKSFKESGLLNVNGPLQLGGMRYQFNEEASKKIWNQPPPTAKGFIGCIRNLTYNRYYYNLGAPSDSSKVIINCNYGLTQAVTFGIDSNFLVAILVCIAILITLMLCVVVFHRNRGDNILSKEMQDDITQNIINYEDEGGGESDAANFDLSVFHQKEKLPIRDNLQTELPEDINSLLSNKKAFCDKDHNNLPFDDVRYYAYEGDGNSTGSLSSLASCTDEGDLKFNYLSSFGPRFRKLADMYGEDASDDDSQEGGEESWC